MSTKEKVTLTLPVELMETVRTLAPPRQQSQFIAEAIEYFIAAKQRSSLRERLIAGYQVNAPADAELAAEWSSLEDEAWQTYLTMAQPGETTSDIANDSANVHAHSAR